jgi:hypothetical protein
MMIQITPHMRIWVAVEPMDFRAGIDGLVAACRKRLQADPFSGALFVFGNRARTAIKILVYDGQGFLWAPARTCTDFAGLNLLTTLSLRRIGREGHCDEGCLIDECGLVWSGSPGHSGLDLVLGAVALALDEHGLGVVQQSIEQR